MAGVANLDDMAKYGLAIKWGQNVFDGTYSFNALLNTNPPNLLKITNCPAPNTWPFPDE